MGVASKVSSEVWQINTQIYLAFWVGGKILSKGDGKISGKRRKVVAYSAAAGAQLLSFCLCLERVIKCIFACHPPLENP